MFLIICCFKLFFRVMFSLFTLFIYLMFSRCSECQDILRIIWTGPQWHNPYQKVLGNRNSKHSGLPCSLDSPWFPCSLDSPGSWKQEETLPSFFGPLAQLNCSSTRSSSSDTSYGKISVDDAICGDKSTNIQGMQHARRGQWRPP